MPDTRFDSLRSALRPLLSRWLDDRREECMLDDDLLDMFETAARAVFDILPDMTIYTDGEPSGSIGELDEDEIHRTFEDYTEFWDEMEWSHRNKIAQPGPLEDTVVKIYELFEGETPEDDDLEEFVHSLRRYLGEAGYDVR